MPVVRAGTRRRILSGEQSVDTLVNEHMGEIEAHILDRDGKIIVETTCPHHGTFTDILATSPEFLGRIERKPSQSNSSSDPRLPGVFPAA